MSSPRDPPRSSPFPTDYASPSPSPDVPQPRSTAHHLTSASPRTAAMAAQRAQATWPQRTAARYSSPQHGDSDGDVADISAPLSATARHRPGTGSEHSWSAESRKYSGDEEMAPLRGRGAAGGPMSRLDMARWLLAGLVMALLLYAFSATLAPPLLARVALTLGRADGRSYSLGSDSQPSGVVLADSAFEEDHAELFQRATAWTSHRTPISGASCSGCSFSFPRPPPGSPTSSFFVTGVPNHGAGVGHQFGEWLMGPWLARSLNLTYISTDLLLQSSRWNTFLGLADGEESIEDLYATYGGVGQILRRSQMDRTQNFDAYPMLNWTRDKIEEIRTDPSQVLLSRSLDASQLTLAQKSLTPGMPFPVLIESHLISVPQHSVLCEPVLHRTVRQKYCAARIRLPVRANFYSEDRAANRLIITWHLRCGDQCFNYFRATTFESIIATTWKLVRLFERVEPGRQPVFHFFSQPPHNESAEVHFAPLFKALEPLTIRTHWYAKSTTVLHHLITSDVLFGAMSSFSWLAFLHHHGVALGTFPSCSDEIPYDRATGEFDEDAFTKSWHKYKNRIPKFNTFQDCLDMQ